MNLNDLGTRLREFVQALRTDLMEMKLLPVVVVLAAAVIGIPIAFAVTNKSAPAAPPQTALPVASGPGAALAATQPAAQHPARGSLGHLHDPFAGHSATSTATAPASPIGARSPSSGATGPAGVSSPPASPAHGTTGPGGATGPAGTSPGSSLKPPLSSVSKRELRVYSVDYNFGQGASLKLISNALRLDAMPANTAPVVQYLGVTKDTAKAAFLIWGPSSASGDGVCIDGQTPCQVVEMKPGETEFIDVLVPGAGIVQFELDMLAIHSKQAATRAEALKAHLLQSAEGVKVLSQSNASALAKFEYSTVYGTLLPHVAQTTGAQQKAGSTRAQANSSAHPSSALGSHRVHHHAHHGRRR
jgi:hypothetical protein